MFGGAILRMLMRRFMIAFQELRNKKRDALLMTMMHFHRMYGTRLFLLSVILWS